MFLISHILCKPTLEFKHMTLTHEVPDDSQDGAEDTERSQDCHKDITHYIWNALRSSHTW